MAFPAGTAASALEGLLEAVPSAPSGLAVRQGGGLLLVGCPDVLREADRLARGYGIERVASGFLPDGTVVSRQESNAWFSNASGEAVSLLVGEAVLEGGTKRFTLALAAGLGTSSLAVRPRGPFPDVVLVAEGLAGPCRVSCGLPEDPATGLLAGLLDALSCRGAEGTLALLAACGLNPSHALARTLIEETATAGVRAWL